MDFASFYGAMAEYGNFGIFLTATFFVFLGFIGAPLWMWSFFILDGMWLWGMSESLIYSVASVLLVFNFTPIRRLLITNAIVTIIQKLKIMPQISETEKTALEAGAVWVDGELFSGKPNFRRIRQEKYTKISAEEKKFLDGPVEELCKMVSDWEVYCHGDLPPNVWKFIKEKKFLGMIIPKEYGGLGFSAIAHSEVVHKVSSHAVPIAITVMVPNSLGPAELLIHYGTEEQKNYYLPRLASGEEIPCFALTEPHAGSDAGSITSSGEIFKGDDGKLYVRLNWNKRYITLAAVSTVIGLAIKLRDPQNLLGKGEDLGITCVLVPAKTKGVVLGKRHNPMGIPFFNCPTRGENVVISVDQIVGGKDGAGKGWKMLMECLAAGRSISLPALATGISKLAARVTSAYSQIRKQFGMSIGKFEGVEEPLARIAGHTYMLEASRVFTGGALDVGVKPAVISAIAKYNMTEIGRKVINDAMDILGGAAISRGPNNTLANPFLGIPIAITVEGANILTRTMIIFGQGALRCHPFAFKEMKSLAEGDVKGFDRAFWGHIGFVVRNACRSLLLSVSRGHLAFGVGGTSKTKRYYQKLSWASASFAFFADVAMGTFGGGLKTKEMITGKFADILSWMYLATATLRRFEAEGEKDEHTRVFVWVMKYCLSNIQHGFDDLFSNMDVPVLKFIFRTIIGNWSRLNRMSPMPSDRLARSVVRQFIKPGAFRDALTDGIFIDTRKDIGMGRYENALVLSYQSDNVYKKIRQAVKAKKLPKKRIGILIPEAIKQNIITADEARVLEQAEIARDLAVQVDSFDLHDYHSGLMENASMQSGQAKIKMAVNK